MSMRVYEVAKKFNLPSKELVNLLKKEGFSVSSHMSVLAESDLAKIEQILGGAKNEVQKETPKKVPPVTGKKESSTDTRKEAAKVETVKHSPDFPKSIVAPKKEKIVLDSSKQERKEAPIRKDKPFLKKFDDEKVQATFKHKKISAPVRAEDDLLEEDTFLEEKTVTPLAKITTLKGDIRGLNVFGEGARKRRSSSKKSAYKRARKLAQQAQEPKVITEITLQGPMPLFEAADLMGKPSSELVLYLLRKGVVANRNHVLTEEMIKELALQFGLSVHTPQVIKTSDEEAEFARLEKLEKEGEQRWPIVVVMGHVDHGKTSLLDYIRNMNTAAREKGGITQHLSAYEAESKHGKIVFLDTPGHEAFSYLRKRGASVTDIAILVVAADDGIMPQTLEAIKHAREAGVPIVVAINKVDKVDNIAIEKVKRQLAQQDLTPEDWGGSTVVVPISAKTGQGVEQLLEMIVLQGQLMDLKALRKAPAKAFILESHVEKGHGPVASIIATEGSLKVGDFFVCGEGTGRVRLLIDSYDRKLKEVGPAIPVKVVGFNNVAEMGDWLQVVPQEEYLKVRSGKGAQKAQANTANQETSTPTAASLFANTDDKRYINVVLKTDTRGSREAIMASLDKIAKEKRDIGCPITVISSGIGDISEGDIETAANTDSFILGFNVKAEKNAQLAAKDKNVTLKLYQIIYQMVDDLADLVEQKRVKKSLWKKTGEAVVRKVFDIKGVGVIAGCYLRDGICTRANKVVCLRNGKKIGEAPITSLQRDRKSVKEVHAGYEFGFMCDAFNDWQVDDTVECLTEYKE